MANTGNIGSVGTAVAPGYPFAESNALDTDAATLAPGSLGSSDLSSLLSGLDTGSGLSDTDVASSLNPSSALSSSSIPNVDLGSSASTDASGGSSITSLLSSLAGSNLGTLAGYGGIYELLASQASNTASQNNALAGQISAIGQPLVTEGQGLTSAFSSGQLTTPYQQQVAASEQQNANTAISQGQQVASLLANSGGGQNVQGAQASESQQIQNAQNQANTQAISQAFQNELTSGMGLVGTGGGFVQSGISQEISSNTQLQGQLASLMGMLAQAYAKQTSGTSGSGTATGGFGSILNSILGTGNSASSLTSGINADTASNVAGLQSGLTSASSSDAANFGNIDADINANTVANLNSGLDTSGLNSASISLGDLTSSESDAGGVAGDISDFSAGGSSAAAPTLAGATAGSDAASSAGSADLSLGSVAGVGGDVLGIAGAALNPTNPSSDVQGAADAYNLGQTLTGGSTIGTGALGASLEVGVPAFMISTLVGALTKPNDPDSINTAAAEQAGMQVNPYGALPSGNSILTDNGLGVGAGTQSSQGSGELYDIQNGTYHWLGQSDSTALEGDVSSVLAGEAGQTPTATTGLGLTTNESTGINPLGSAVSQPAQTAAQEEAAGSSGISSIFSSLGGAKALGMSESDFQQTLIDMLGSNAYLHGTAYGNPN
jgi:hypothetical protein